MKSVIRFLKYKNSIKHIHKYHIVIEHVNPIIDIVSCIYNCLSMEKYSCYEGIVKSSLDSIKSVITCHDIEHSDVNYSFSDLSYDITIEIDCKNDYDIQVGVRDKSLEPFASVEQTKDGSYVLFLHNSVSSAFE